MRWRYEKWVKLYVREEGSFSQLPLYVRAIAGELLKICDEAGRIALRGKEPWAAIAFQLGSDASDRRLLRKHIPQLLEDGYLELAGGDLVIRNFTVAQTGVDRVRATIAQPADSGTTVAGERTEHEPSVNETRVEREPCTNEARTVHEPCTTSELLDGNQTASFRRSDLIDIREGERRARGSLATEAVQRLNTIRRTIAARHRLLGVQDLPSQVSEPIQFRLADGWDPEKSPALLDHVLACLEAEADEARSVEFLAASSFQPTMWAQLVATTPDAARARKRRGLDAAAADDLRRGPRFVRSVPSMADDPTVTWYPDRSDEAAS
jgi:hypothetical protein